MTVVEKLLTIIAATQHGIDDMPFAQMLRRLAIERLAKELAKETP